MSGRILFLFRGKANGRGLPSKFSSGVDLQFITPLFSFICAEVADIQELSTPPAGSGRRRILALPSAPGEIACMGGARLASNPRTVVRGVVVPAEQPGRDGGGEAR